MDTNPERRQRTSSAVRDETFGELLPLHGLASHGQLSEEGTCPTCLNPEVTQRTRQAVQAFYEYANGCSGGTGRVLRHFIRERPVETQILIETYDATHPGLNHLPARKFTSPAAKVRFALEDARETDGGSRSWGEWIRRHRLVVTVVALGLALPMLLSPTHPIAVYSFLIHSYDPSFTPKAFASFGTDLSSFLTSPAQVQRYKADLREDMIDTRSGKIFVIVRRPDGTLHQEAIRTWNGFLPAGLPVFLSNWLDRRELPFLGDEVEVWQRGNTIVAMGHYHAFGGAPSAGDTCAQRFSDLPEVVIVNGVVPMIYMDGNVVSYGDDVVVSEEVFRSLRTLESSVTMDVTQNFTFSKEPSQAFRSFLGFLRDYRNVDLSRNDNVARGILQLCVEFKDDYRAVFTKGFLPSACENDLDKSNFLENLDNVDFWARYTVRWSEITMQAARNDDFD